MPVALQNLKKSHQQVYSTRRGPLSYGSSLSFRATPQYLLKIILLFWFLFFSPSLPLQQVTVDCVAGKLANQFCCTETVKKITLKLLTTPALE